MQALTCPWPLPPQPLLTGNAVDLVFVPPLLQAAQPRRERIDHLLRGVLAAYVDRAPADLRFAREAHGRPYLVLPGAPDFNLSDTDGGSVIAIAARGRVGVDLESSARRPPAQRLAQRYFAADEVAALAALDADAAAAAFIRLWTAKEAACKATGTGIFGWLDRWVFDATTTQPHALQIPEAAGTASDWHFQRWTPAPGLTAVLAVQGYVPLLRRQIRIAA